MRETLDDENSVRVRTDFYNEIMDAADAGFVALVRRRDALRKLMDSLPSYPERDAAKMKTIAPMMVGDIEIARDDVMEMWRRADDKVKRLATALNARYAEGVGDKYKA